MAETYEHLLSRCDSAERGVMTLRQQLAALREENAKLQDAPLCANHADAWYTGRNHIETSSGCIWCDLQQENAGLAALVEQVKEKISAAAAICGRGSLEPDAMYSQLDDAYAFAHAAEKLLSTTPPAALAEHDADLLARAAKLCVGIGMTMDMSTAEACALAIHNLKNTEEAGK